MSTSWTPCGIPLRTLRSTRLVDLVNTMDPKIVATALGMNADGVLLYLAGHIDPGRETVFPAKLGR